MGKKVPIWSSPWGAASQAGKHNSLGPSSVGQLVCPHMERGGGGGVREGQRNEPLRKNRPNVHTCWIHV